MAGVTGKEGSVTTERSLFEFVGEITAIGIVGGVFVGLM
jgi:hypothetical protein